MDLTLILGPMKSGKSFDLISFFAPLKYSNVPFGLYQSMRNVRDEHIFSRNGTIIEAKKIQHLSDILPSDAKVVGIDEIHMFQPEDVLAIEELLKQKIRVIVSGLDLDYRGKMFDVVKGLFELAPKEVRFKRAVCENCRTPEAIYSQVFRLGKPLTSGMPPVIPDDGTFGYMPVCRDCFVRV